MELHAYTRTISDLFSVKKKYVVPRFQREYSWEKEQVLALCEDLLSKITPTEEFDFVNQEYFIGALVLIGEDKSFELQIVDGQQRLTTITIFLSALIEAFKKIGKDNFANAIHENYIQGKDDESREYFKLINETPKPFFQNNIQANNKSTVKPETEEEVTLKNAYDEIVKKLDKKSIISRLDSDNVLNTALYDEIYSKYLLSIRDQVLHNLKVIYITVKDEDDAYTIFETLNARGMNLSAVDLIKNEIFKNLKKIHPDDDAKTNWKKIRTNLLSRDFKINIDTFFRHFWLSNYSFTSEDKIYRTFKDLTKKGKFDYGGFLNKIIDSSSIYNKIANPNELDWKRQEERVIYESLKAFNIFNVTQIRSLLLALIDLRNSGFLKLSDLIGFIEKLERFHFVFTAICSSRASGLEGTFSKTARHLRNSRDRIEAIKAMNELMAVLIQKLPSLSNFKDNLKKMNFSSDKDRAIIKYIFKKYELYLRDTNEVTTHIITIEHIISTKRNGEFIQQIGNLLPLDAKLNNDSENFSLKNKLPIYQKSELKSVREFIAKYNSIDLWTEELANQRIEELADVFYNKVWKI